MKTRHLLPAVVVAAATTLALPETASAQQIGTQRRFGLGLVAGYNGLGLSFNYFMNPGFSLQIDPVIWARGESFLLGARVDGVFWPAPLARWQAADLRWFVGPGVWFALVNGGYYRFGENRVYPGNGFGLALEGTIGLGLQFHGAPIDLNLELIPRVWLFAPDGVAIFFDLGAALNARYYF